MAGRDLDRGKDRARDVDPVMPENSAEMVVVPIAIELATPLPSTEFATVETDSAEDDHTTRAVRSWTEPSAKVPVAVNACVVPRTITGSTGVTAIETSVALEIVSVVEPVTPECVAEIAVSPRPTECARPWLPASFEIVDVPVAEDSH